MQAVLAFSNVKIFYLLTRCALAATMVLASSRGASAQLAPPVTRGDVAATAGWLGVHKGPSGPYDNSNWHSSLFGAISTGWYWTDNLKTEIDFGGGTKARDYRTTSLTIEGRPIYIGKESTFARHVLGLSQQYQFFHNVWFHPHLAAGVNVTWEHVTDNVNPIPFYDDLPRTGQIPPAVAGDGEHTDVSISPFVATGFKAYLTPRAFFRGDLRVGFRGGPADAIVRAGFGVDF